MHAAMSIYLCFISFWFVSQMFLSYSTHTTAVLRLRLQNTYRRIHL